jgi:hypothetical protein
MVCPTSPAASVYDPHVVAPRIGEDVSAWFHWQANEDGVLVQVPFVADSPCPTAAVPLTTGSAVLTGTDAIIVMVKFSVVVPPHAMAAITATSKGVSKRPQRLRIEETSLLSWL